MNHLIITAHGIRTYGDWQERLENLTREARPQNPPEHMVLKYGFFSFLQYVIPPLRWVKVSLFCRELRHKLQSKSWDRIDIVGHSFGTYIIAYGLRKLAQDHSLKFKVNVVIFAGSVLRDNFPWQPLLNKHVSRLVNDCGTKDNVLLLNQLFVLFAGLAGRFGFSGGLGNNFRNRMFPFSHSGYFEAHPRLSYADKDDFMRMQWLPLLLGEGPIPPTVPVTPTVTDGIRDFVFRNMEPIKLAIWLIPLLAIIWTFYDQKVEANRQRENAEAAAKKLIEADAQQEALLLRASHADHEAGLRAFAENREPEGIDYFVRALIYRPNNSSGLAAAASHAFGINTPRWHPRLNALFTNGERYFGFSTDSSLIVVGSGESRVRAVEMTSGNPLSEVEFGSRVENIVIDGVGHYVAVTGNKTTAHFVDARSGKEVRTQKFDGEIAAITTTPDGRVLAAVTDEDNLEVLDLRTQRRMANVPLSSQAQDVQFSSGGNRFAFISPRPSPRSADNEVLLVFDSDDGKKVADIQPLDQITWAVLSPDGKYVVSLMTSGVLSLHLVGHPKALWEKKLNPEPGTAVFSPDSRMLAIGTRGTSGGIQIVAAATGSVLYDASLGGRVEPIFFSPDGRLVAAGCANKKVVVLDYTKGSRIGEWDFEYYLETVCFSPNGAFLVIGEESHPVVNIRIYETGAGREVQKVELSRGVSSLQFSADSRQVLFEYIGGTSKQAGFQPLFVSPDNLLVGKREHFLENGNTAGVAERANGKLLCTLRFATDVQALSFSPNGSRFAAADGGGFLANPEDPAELRVIDTQWLRADRELYGAFGAALAVQSGRMLEKQGELKNLPISLMGEARVAIADFVRQGPPSNAKWQHAILKWATSEPERRSTSPWATEPMRLAAGRWFMQASGKLPSFITDTADVAPWHPLEPLSLARLEPRPGYRNYDAVHGVVRPTFLARLTLQRLRGADEQLYGREVLAEYATWAAKIMDQELKLYAEAKEAIAFAIARTPPEKRKELLDLEAKIQLK